MTRRGTAAFWLLLALAGQAGVLALTLQGPFVRYQHLRPPAEWPSIPWAVALVLLQAAVVAAGLVRRRAAVRRTLRAVAPGAQAPLLLAAMLATAAAVSRDLPVYVGELALAALLQLLQLANVALVAATLPDGACQWLRDRWARLTSHADAMAPGGVDRFDVACAAVVTSVAILLAVTAYQLHPHVPDEVVYLLHARYLAEGLWWMPPPPVPAAFDVDLMTLEAARWYSPVPIGWPAVLAAGAFLGVPFLVNPVLAGVNVLLASVLLREWLPRSRARLVVLLLVVSPWHTFLGMSLMPHTATLAAALAAALAVARLRRTGRLGWAVPAGMALGMVALIRPLEGLAMAALLGPWALWARGAWRPVAAGALALMTAATAALTLPYNRALTGSATTFPIMAYTDRLYGPGSNSLGFGPSRGLGWGGLDPFPGHGLRDVIVNTNLNVFQINVELLGVGSGVMLLLALGLPGAWRDRAGRAALLVIAVITGLHTAYWFSGGPDFGARYWFLVLVPCLILVARGIEVLAARTGPRAGVAVAVLAVVALTLFVPWRAADKYRYYRGMRPGAAALAQAHGFARSLVLVRGRRHPDFHSVVNANAIGLDGDGPVYAWDRDTTTRAALRAAFADRPVWILDGPSVSGGAWRIAAGPIPPGAPLPVPPWTAP